MTNKYFNPGADISDAAVVRTAVFVDEQGFSKELEFDDLDGVSHHVVFYSDKNQPIATGRMFPENEEGQYHLGRIAVLKNYRGTGVGAKIMQALEEKAKIIGAKALHLGAQTHAKGFYEKVGYHISGEEFLEEGVPHVMMSKELGA